MSRIKQLLRDESGQDMVEYGLLAALISIAALLTVRAIGPLVNALYEKVRDEIS
jgi:Flp pilus assembly pilin Flp